MICSQESAIGWRYDVTATIAGMATALRAVTSPPAEKVTPGFLGFAVVFVLALATFLLIRSMVGHLRKVRYSAEPGTEPAVGSGAPGVARSSGGTPKTPQAD
jgi:hypothetical protein